MKVQDYIKRLGISEKSYIKMAMLVCEIINEKEMYRPTPIHCIWEWKECLEKHNYIVLNTKAFQPAWMSGADWNPEIENNQLMSLLVIEEKDAIKRYGSSCIENTIKYIDEEIEAQIATNQNPWLNRE